MIQRNDVDTCMFMHAYLHICTPGLFEASVRITTDFSTAQVYTHEFICRCN